MCQGLVLKTWPEWQSGWTIWCEIGKRHPVDDATKAVIRPLSSIQPKATIQTAPSAVQSRRPARQQRNRHPIPARHKRSTTQPPALTYEAQQFVQSTPHDKDYRNRIVVDCRLCERATCGNTMRMGELTDRVLKLRPRVARTIGFWRRGRRRLMAGGGGSGE